jgi:hypothetical protein
MATIVLQVPDENLVSKVKQACKMIVGVTSVKLQKNAKPRLYDPETGEFLNDKTMKAIEKVRSGKDKGTTYSSFEEFEKAMRAL